MSLPVRRPGRRAQARGPVRASADRVAAARTLGLAGIILSVALCLLLTAGGAFAVGPAGLDIEGARYTSRTAIEAALGLGAGRAARLDLVTLRAGPAEQRLRALPAVDAAAPEAAQVRVVLPDRLVVAITERHPILAWEVGSHRFLADDEGLLFAELGDAGGPDLPTVQDEQTTDAGLAVGRRLDPVAFAAVRKLAAVGPALIGSRASSLRLALTDDAGFTLGPPNGWEAIFGLYTTTIRPPSTVDRQVQCLTSLLAAVGEAKLDTIYLSPTADACGTYTLAGKGS
ncbi:MAG TPA: hypothetical protein VFW92_06250 [Candidatus Limnocylindrales bacterium]|nr:hypothetical protein [Candidatus Limnocylindrales bacterium]